MATPPPLQPAGPRRTSTALIIGLLFGIVAVAGAVSLYTEEVPRTVAYTLLAFGLVTSVLGCIFAYIGISAHPDQKAVGIFTLAMNALALACIVFGGVRKISESAGQLRESWARVTKDAESSSEEDIVDIAGEPIPQDPNALTFAKAQALYEEWAQEKMVAGYEKHGRKDPRWDVPAREVIGRTMSLWITAYSEALEPEMEEKVRLLFDSEDPLVAYICARFAKSFDPIKARQLLSRAAQDLPTSGYSPSLLYLARVEYWSQLKSNRATAQQADELVPACLEALRQALAERPLTENDHFVWQYFIDQFTPEAFFEEHGDKVCSVLDESAGVQDWLKHRFRGKRSVDLAWQARGTGYSNTVSRDGWKGFAAHLKDARKELTKSWELNPKHPAAASQMIAVTMGSDGDAAELRQWFDRAVTARFDYQGAYDSLLWALRPRWGGSHEAMITFGEACADTERFDTVVPWKLLKAARDISSEWDEPSAYFREDAPGDALLTVCRGYAKQGTDELERAYGLSQGAILAQKFDRLPDARQFLQEANFRLSPRAAKEWNLDAETWHGEVAAQSGPIAEPLRDAERALAGGDFETALKQLAAALETADLHPAERAFVEQRAVAVRELQAMEAAPWLPFRLPEGGAEEWKAAGWKVGGNWQQISPETLELKGSNRTSLASHPQFGGGAVELRGEIEFVSHENKEAEATLYYGSDFMRGARYLTIRFRQQEGERDTVTLALGSGSDKFTIRTDLPQRVPFVVRIAAGRVRVQLSDRTVLERPMPNIGPGTAAAPLVLAVAAPRDNSPYVLRYHNLEIRVPKAPAAASAQ